MSRQDAARRENAATNIKRGRQVPAYPIDYPQSKCLTLYLSGDVWRKLNAMREKRGAVTMSSIITEVLIDRFEAEGIK